MKIHSLILAALVLVGGTATLTAQVDSTILRDRQIKAMTELLQLTPEQQEKLKGIFDKQGEQLRAVHQDQTTSREEKAKQFQTLRELASKQVAALLTKEQAEKFSKASAAKPGAGEGAGEGAGKPLEHIAKLVEQLGLKPEQKAKFAAFVQEQGEKMLAIHQNQNMSREDKESKMREAGEVVRTKLQGLLTPEQIEKLTQLHAASQGGQGNNLQERLVKLSEQLGLKPEQKTKFIAIAQEHDEKTRAIHQDQNTSREDKDAKVNALNEASKTKMQELLTAEQFEKLIQLHSQPEKKN